ncbi:hypothetical protein [Hamadaea tsunoensis]|uniref:hypothetical protein n=1 Tax=Hamadaea tsunoensis TaxID=53368 RepID=UPI0012F93182|nr:hypothetical protein [Hamadaea tsunoensis]
MLSDFFLSSKGHGGRDVVYFARENAVLDADELKTITRLAEAGPDVNLDIVGTASDDECYSRTDLTVGELVDARVVAVVEALKTAGWKGKPAVLSVVKNTEYATDPRGLRRVTIAATKDQSSASGTAAKPEPPHRKAAKEITDAQGQAEAYVDKVVGILDAKAGDEEYIKVVATAKLLFSDRVDLRSLSTDLKTIGAFLRKLREREPGGTAHKPGFRFVAYGGSSLAVTKGHKDEAVIDFGPDMLTARADSKALTFVHESAHAVLRAKDIAYADRRLFWKLDQAQATRNADSYGLFVLMAARDYEPSKLPPQDDTRELKVDAELDRPKLAVEALAYAETYLGLAAHDVDHAYRRVWRHVLDDGMWSDSYEGILKQVRIAFPGELTRGSSPARPDDIVLTGIHRRLRRMRDPIVGKVVTFEPGSSARFADGTLTLPSAFFTQSLAKRVEAVLLALAAAESSVPSAMRQQYATLVVNLAAQERYAQ